MHVGEPPHGSRSGEIRLVIVESPDLAAPLVGALDAAEVGAWVWVEAEHCLYWSPRIPEMLGLDQAHDLLGEFVSRVDAADRPLMRTLIQGDWRDDVFSLRFRYRHPQLGSRWLFMLGRLNRGPGGELLRQGGTIRDVTADVRREEERAEASARLEALVNAMPFSVWGRSGPNLILTHLNAASIDIWGDILGTGLEAARPEVAKLWRKQLTDAMSGKEVRDYSRVMHRGKEIVLRDIIAPVTVNGEVTGVVGVAIDVTEEHRRREFEALLTDIAADFVSRSLETLDAGIHNALERIARFVGAGFGALCEISSENHVHLTHWWVETGAAPREIDFDAAPMQAFLERMSRNEAVVVNAADQVPAGSSAAEWLAAKGVRSFVTVPLGEAEGRRMALGLAGPHGTAVVWPEDVVPLLRLSGTILSGAVARQRAEAHRRVVEQRRQDTQKLESLGVLAGGIAHDFNNLLTAILGNASLLRAEMPMLEGLQDPLEQIEIASRRAADLCRQMLAYAGRGRFALHPVDINDVVRESEAFLRVTVPKKASLEIHLKPDLASVRADHAQIRQVLMNLVINAAEAIGDGEGRIVIATSETMATSQELAGTLFTPQLDEGHYVTLAVSDTGAGMTPEVMARIFEPFFSTKFTGRGLGLPAVVGIVRAHKGAVRVTSTVDAGSTFEFLLPAEGVESSAPGPRNAAHPDGSLAKWKTTGTVLVVDDDAGVRDLIRTVLERAGLRVVLAEDGQAGVDTFQDIADEVRLVLVDLMMPRLDGREALAAMRRIRPDLPAILMSGYTPADVVSPGPHWFLQKPFTPVTVRQIVWRALSETDDPALGRSNHDAP